MVNNTTVILYLVQLEIPFAALVVHWEHTPRAYRILFISRLYIHRGIVPAGCRQHWSTWRYSHHHLHGSFWSYCLV
jgi:hypothetical protein